MLQITQPPTIQLRLKYGAYYYSEMWGRVHIVQCGFMGE